MCRILVVDEAVPACDQLCGMIAHHPAAATVAIERCALDDVVQRVGESPRVDILFVDVNAGGAAGGGIALVHELERRNMMPLVVYLATRETYTSAVYSTRHQYLLLEPLSQREVRAALDKVFGMLGTAATAPVMLRSGGSTHVIDPHEVQFVQSQGRKVLVSFADGRELLAYAALSELEQQLPGAFVRCHKSYLANMEHVRTSCHNALTMASGACVPVSQRQYRAVRDALASYTAQ